MKEYLFKVLLRDGSRFVPIIAKDLQEAREKFEALMKESFQKPLEWFLLRIYCECEL